MTPLICVQDASKILGISRSKLYQLIEDERIPFVRIDGRVLFREDLLETWIQEQVVQPGAGKC